MRARGAIGPLIIEPPNAIISEFDTYRRAVATISGGTEGTFREFLLLFQNDVNMRTDQSLGYFCGGGTRSPGAGQGWPVEITGD